jgi:two-component system, chemotaxis family, chemotaxis protein CheY
MANVMVIDDDDAVRGVIAKMLERDGHTVTEVEDGKRALRYFAGQPSDLVISDVYMPEMDGIEFLMRLREAFPETRIIMMSGGGVIPMDEVLEASTLLGAVGSLQKPIDMKQLRSAVAEALGDPEV